MATEFINGQWRIPNDWNVDESNQNKISNYSMDFSGVDGNINLGAGSPFNFNTADSDLPFSFSMWFNRGDETMVNASALFAKNSEGSLQQYRVLYFNQRLRLMIAPQGTGGSESFIDLTNTWIPDANQWYHLVFTYDGGGEGTSASGLKMYIDKVEQAVTITQISTYTNMITTAAPLVIGSRSNDSFYSIGSFDLFSVFNYELTQAQIDILYGDSAAGYFQVGNPMAITPNPVAFYPLGDQDLIFAGANWLIPNQVAGTDSLVFNFSATQFIGCGNNSSINQVGTVFTMSCWVNTTSQVRGSIMGTFNTTNYGGYFIELMANGTVFGGFNSNLFNSRAKFSLATVDDGNWHHVCYTISGTNTSDINVYIDGVASNGTFSQQGTPANANTTNSFQINNQSTSSSARYIGLTSNVQVFTATLTGSEVSTLYNNGIPLLSLSSIPQNSSLQGWWKLNETTTLIAGLWVVPDDSANTNGGLSSGMTASNRVLSNLPKASGGYSPYAIELNGTDENFVVDNSSKDLNTDFISISAWFFQDNPAANSSFPAIIINGFQGSGSSYWGLVMRPGNVVRVQLKLTDSNGNTAFVIQDITETITTDQWNHVAMTYDGTTLKGYVNGVEETLSLVTSAPGVTPIVTSSGPILYSVPGMNSQDLLIGKRGTDSFRINGKLSNISIFSSGLSTAQMATIYNNGIPGDISSLNPLAWWELGSMMGFNGVNTYTALSNTDSNYAAVSTSNMDADNVVNGPGYSDGGSGTSSLVIEKQAPYSFNNALSESMAISNRDDSQASDPYPLMTELDLTSETSSYTFTTPTLYTSGDISIDWGDGSAIQQTGTISNTKLTHVYDTDAYPRPLIQWGRSTDAGKISIFLVQSGVSRTTISNLKQWGKSFNGTQINFLSASNMVITAQDIPDLSNVTTLASMFQNCSSITTIPNIEKWDVSNKAVSASSMFRSCSNFIATDLDNFADNIFTAQLAIFGACSSLNSTSLSKWRTRGNMGEAFENMSSLDQDLSTKTVTRANTSTYIAWDISDCTSIFQLLDFNSGFTGTNPNISNWDTSNIIGNGFGYLTLSAKINSDMSTKQISTPNPYNTAYTAWDVSGGTNFISMFQGNSIFNQNLRTWQLNESTTGLSQMFTSTTAFSDDNYTDTLVGWAVYLYGVENPPENLSLGNTTGLSFQSSRTVNSDDNGSTTTNYSSLYPSLFPETWTQAGDARDFLQETLGWSSTAGPL